MPRPAPDPAKIDHAAELYASGKTFSEAAAEVGLNSETVRLALRRRGVEARPRSERPGSRRIDPPDQKFVNRYLGGESENALASSYGVSRTAMQRWLREAGVERRGVEESQALQRATLTPEERRRKVAAAHDAVRGRPQTEEFRQRVAAGRERVGYGGRSSPGTEVLSELLTERGVEHVREKAVGRYNVDLAFSGVPIAVEVLGGNWHGSKPIHARRTPYILDRGWVLVFVWDLKRCKIGPAAADYLITLAEEARRDPSLVGQYRVIRGDGELVAGGSVDDDEFPLVPPSVRGLN